MVDSRWEVIVRPKLPDLVKVLQPADFMPRLFASKLLTKDEYENLDRTRSNKEVSAALLITILPRKGPKAYDNFIKVLLETEGQEHIADLLQQPQEEMPHPHAIDGKSSVKDYEPSSSAQTFSGTLSLAPNQEMPAETLNGRLAPMTGSNNQSVADLAPSSSPHHQSAEVESDSEERSPMKQSVKRFRIVVVIDGWSSTKGGIQTFSRAMCKALAQEEDVEIACMVTELTKEDDDDAKASGVKLFSQKSDRLSLLSDFQPNVLIGHGIKQLAEQMNFLKELLTAKEIHYKTVQILHVYPFLLQQNKETKGAASKANAKTSELLNQAQSADIVAAVGPRLASWWANRLRKKEFVQLNPGLYHDDCNIKVKRSHQVAGQPQRCLLTARLDSEEDQKSKGLHVAVEAMKLYSQQLENTPNTARAVFEVRGFKDSAACDHFRETTQPQLSKISIEAKAFDADEEEVKRDMEAADVFLMPSLEEGFGLTALEALSVGTPVLCSENSGFAEVLKQIQDDDKDRGEFISNWIVSRKEMENGQQLGMQIWSMLRTSKTRQDTYKEAEELQKQWQERYSWPRMVRTLLDKLGVLINP
jgi:glycosyltransferase involved in cell wall biosynthesis